MATIWLTRGGTADRNPPFHRYLENWKIITNFAGADRLSEAPVWGYEVRDVAKIH